MSASATIPSHKPGTKFNGGPAVARNAPLTAASPHHRYFLSLTTIRLPHVER